MDYVREFDFIGLFLLVTGVVLLLVGFNASETSWSSTETIVLLVLGCVFLVLGVINEAFTKRSPVIPPRLFQTRTTAVLIVSTFIHSFAFLAMTFYEPVYFQVLGVRSFRFSAPVGILISTCRHLQQRLA
jgi:uncharacterized membrane protein HdeD (DUF308 family)